MIQCPSCGGALRFDIASQHMVCDACDSHYDPASTASMNKDAQGVKTFESYVFSCPSCGGELLTTDQTDAVGFCPFCGGASMLFDRIHRQWEPEYIIPFQITKEQCKVLYAKEAKKSIFTAKQYRDPQLIESFRGIYMPYYNYRVKQKGPFTIKGVKHGGYDNQYYDVDGKIDLVLDGYSHDASKAFDDRISEDIAPYDPAGRKSFAPGYLSGFYADIGDVSSRDYNEKGTQAVKEHTAKVMKKDRSVIAGLRNGMASLDVDVGNSYIPTKIESSQRALYPVWFMSYRNKDKITYAAVNGQTGKVSADLPVSPWRVLIAVLILGAALAAAMFFLPSLKANWVLLISVALLVIGTIVLKRTFSAAVNKETGLDATEEAKRFVKFDTVRLVFTIILAVLGVILGLIDYRYNIVTYLGCLAMGAMLFINMLCHIRFQAEIAKRRPPQFSKKGAAYDEN